MWRYKAIVEYIGTNFVGWQRQQNGISIQQVLEDTVSLFTKQKVNIFASGRTDAGVHALGQVLHFDLGCFYEPSKLMNSINHFLRPHAITLLNCELTDFEFHARFSSKARHYKYKIVNRVAPLVIDKDRAWLVRQPLDTAKMEEATQYLIGKHDFTSFRATACQSNSPVKTLDKIKIISNYNDEIQIWFLAQSFLHHMVRNIVGTLVEVGINKRLPIDVKRILAARNRTVAGPLAPAAGLYFVKVDY